MPPMVLLGDKPEVEAHFYAFGDSANLDVRWVQYLCGTYLGSKNILDAPDGTPR
jgi:hypothetical protein